MLIDGNARLVSLVRAGDLHTPAVRTRQQLGLAVPAVAIDRPDGVDDVLGLEVAAGGELGVAGRAAAELPARRKDRRPAGTMNRAIDAAAAAQSAVRRVDDGVGVLMRDVTLEQLDSTRPDGEFAHARHPPQMALHTARRRAVPARWGRGKWAPEPHTRST